MLCGYGSFRRYKDYKKTQGKGVEIINNFTLLATKNNISLSYILEHLSVHCIGNVIFVEGIMDYYYLSALKKLYNAERNKKLNISFIPINGVGGKKFNDYLESKNSRLNVYEIDKLIIKNANCKINTIEDLFLEAEIEKLHLDDKSSAQAYIIKSYIEELKSKYNAISNETKGRFYEVLYYLDGLFWAWERS